MFLIENLKKCFLSINLTREKCFWKKSLKLIKNCTKQENAPLKKTNINNFNSSTKILILSEQKKKIKKMIRNIIFDYIVNWFGKWLLNFFDDSRHKEFSNPKKIL